MAVVGSQGQSRREQVRRVGLSGNYWYAAELSKSLGRGEVKEVVFWRTSIAVYRGQDGTVRAMENRCAHRQLRLSEGAVEGNLLVCNYHGWKYDGGGKCKEISHEQPRAGRKLPDICVRSFPVRERYGFIWIFPGNPELAETTPMPVLPQLEQAKPWPVAPIDVTIKSHFSMIVENVCDFNHAYLHKRFKPFVRPKMKRFGREDDTISVDYDTAFGEGGLAKVAAEKGGKSLDGIGIAYDYPYQRSDISGKYLHWLFMLPIDEQTTRCFFLFLFGPIELPYLGVKLPEMLRKPVLDLANRFYIKPLLAEDKWALEEEQRAHAFHASKPSWEFNPIITAFQKMTLEKWSQYRDSEVERVNALPAGPGRFMQLGAGLTHVDMERSAAAEAQDVTDDMGRDLVPAEALKRPAQPAS